MSGAVGGSGASSAEGTASPSCRADLPTFLSMSEVVLRLALWEEQKAMADKAEDSPSCSLRTFRHLARRVRATIHTLPSSSESNPARRTIQLLVDLYTAHFVLRRHTQLFVADVTKTLLRVLQLVKAVERESVATSHPSLVLVSETVASVRALCRYLLPSTELHDSTEKLEASLQRSVSDCSSSVFQCPNQSELVNALLRCLVALPVVIPKCCSDDYIKHFSCVEDDLNPSLQTRPSHKRQRSG